MLAKGIFLVCIKLNWMTFTVNLKIFVSQRFTATHPGIQIDSLVHRIKSYDTCRESCGSDKRELYFDFICSLSDLLD